MSVPSKVEVARLTLEASWEATDYTIIYHHALTPRCARVLSACLLRCVALRLAFDVAAGVCRTR